MAQPSAIVAVTPCVTRDEWRHGVTIGVTQCNKPHWRYREGMFHVERPIYTVMLNWLLDVGVGRVLSWGMGKVTPIWALLPRLGTIAQVSRKWDPYLFQLVL